MNTSLLFSKKRLRLPLAIGMIFALLTATQVLAAAGSLDPTFGTNGIAITDLGSDPRFGSDIALQPDGRILLLVPAQGQQMPVLMRYNSNGSVDSTFGADGKLTLDFGCCLAIQLDGKLLVAGSKNRGIVVARYDNNGKGLDNTFGTNGVTTIPLSEGSSFSVSDLAIEPSNRIVITGTWYSYGNSVYSVIARLNSDGTPYDTDYGRVIWLDNVFSYKNYNFAQAVAAQPDGKIVVFGNTMDNETYHMRPFLVRLNQNGSPDRATFGTTGSGAVIIPISYFHDGSGSMVIQANGKIVVAGTVGDVNDVHTDLIVTRFNTNGTPDTAFGGTGIVTTDFGANEFGADLALQSDGKIIVVGTSSASGVDNLLIARYNTDGSLDNTFGNNGRLIGGLGTGPSWGAGIEIQPNGRIIVAGSSNGNAFLARYNMIDTAGTSTAVSYESTGSFDGWILESGENSNAGKTFDRGATTINIGDDQKDRQYRAILSFNTNSIPDYALITSAQVKMRKQGVAGTDPLLTYGELLLEMRNGSFSNSLTLQAGDFADAASPGTFVEHLTSLTNNWYGATLSNTNLGFINTTGVTQFRVRFSQDDNDNMKADYVKFYSGNAAEANRPQLAITYTLDSGNASSIMQFSLPIVAGANQPPAIASNGGLASASISVPENNSTVTTVTGTDPDLPAQTLTYSISGGADSSRFIIDPATGAVTFVSAPDFELPTDIGLDNIYNVTVQVTDGSLAVAQDISVAVTNLNDNAPAFTSSNGFSVAENSFPVTTVTASDADLPAQVLTFSIAGGVDSFHFNIDPAIGLLYFKTPPDFDIPVDADLNNIYNVTVQVSDGNIAATQDISFTVTNVNDNAPVITSPYRFSIPENISAVTAVTASDADLPAQLLTYSIAGGIDAGLFTINSTTGELVFVAAPNYEVPTDAGLDNTYNVIVQVSDGSLAVTQDLAVIVTPVNDNSPLITSVSALGTGFNIPENVSTVTVVTATDADLPVQTLSYSIVGGVDSAIFTINSSTGELAFLTAPDFEAPTDTVLDNIYNITVQASDGMLSITQDIFVTVTPINDNAPVITSLNAISILENTSRVTTLTATDADLPAQTLSFSIAGGLDATRFSIDPATGVLTFVAPPDFESPTDAGLDNIYNVTVQAFDGTSSSNQELAVTVSPVNDNNPIITSMSGLTFPENTLAVTTVTASDADRPLQILTYSIIAGADSIRFSINPFTGALSFVNPPDFEAPTDIGLDQVYNVRVQASDGTRATTQDISVTISNINE